MFGFGWVVSQAMDATKTVHFFSSSVSLLVVKRYVSGQQGVMNVVTYVVYYIVSGFGKNIDRNVGILAASVAVVA